MKDEWPKSPVENDSIMNEPAPNLQAPRVHPSTPNENKVVDRSIGQEETWGRLRQLGGAAQAPVAPSEEEEQQQGPSAVEDAFGRDIATATASADATTRLQGVEAILELLREAKLLGQGDVMFAPSLGLVPVPREVVVDGGVEVIKELLVDESPDCSDMAIPCVQELLRVMEPQAQEMDLVL